MNKPTWNDVIKKVHDSWLDIAIQPALSNGVRVTISARHVDLDANMNPIGDIQTQVYLDSLYPLDDCTKLMGELDAAIRVFD